MSDFSVREVSVLGGKVTVEISRTAHGFEPSAKLQDGFYIFHLGPSATRSEAFEKAKREIARMILSGDLDAEQVHLPAPSI